MAQRKGCRCRGRGLFLALVILVHLGVVSFSEGADAGCPSYPADPSWKDGIEGDQLTAIQVRIMRSLRVLAGTFQQGEKPLLTRPDSNSEQEEVQGVRLVATKAELSDSLDVYKVSVMLTLGFRQKYSPQDGATQDVNINGDGTFNEQTGELCVLGCITMVCKYRISLLYPAPKSIHRVYAVGNISSVVDASDPTFFDPVSLHLDTDWPFQHTMNATLARECPKMESDVAVGKLWKEKNVCSQGWASFYQVWSSQLFDVVWNPECQGANCSPFAKIGRAGDGSVSSLRFDRIRCDGNRIQGILVVTENLQAIDRFADPTATNGTLIAGGTWDPTTGKMCMIACHLDGKEDCEIAVTMQFPLTFTISQRALVVGHIRSLRKETDAAYFKPITFWQLLTSLGVNRFTSVTNQPEYVYTKVETAKTHCASDTTKKPSSSSSPSKTYPTGADWRDLEVYALKNGARFQNGANNFVNLNVFTFGDQFVTYGALNVTSANVTGLAAHGVTNVSYAMYYSMGESASDANMAAEGIYDPEIGKICVIGCRTVNVTKKAPLEQVEGNGRMDCQVFITVQLPPVTSPDVLRATVKSLRDPKDPLFFKTETFSGTVRIQAAAAVWRIDLEIVISVVMLSLTVVFILVQLVYSKRYPETLPYISTSMLLLLSLAHMIPLVLNFEALFLNRQVSVYGGFERIAGWPEVNEVVVRLTTMTAMLLQLRLLQLVWKSRSKSRTAGDVGTAAVQERRVLFTILPIYILGGLVAILLHALQGFRPYERGFLWRSNQGGLWWDIKAYGGLLLDFHLFPQVVGNILWGAKEHAPLSMPFYFGMALVQSLPHVYDLCRKFRFIPAFSEMYLYANPEWHFYSVTSDILIPVVIVSLAVMVYMQQRWGGRCLLPRRWRTTFEYEKIRVTNIEA